MYLFHSAHKEFPVTTVLTALCVLLACVSYTNSQQNTAHVSLVYIGSVTNLTCSPDAASKLNKFNYTWTYNGSPTIRHATYSDDNESIIFINTETKFSGNYECWEEGIDQNGKSIIARFYHHLIVYELPTVTAEVSQVYKVPLCNPVQDRSTARNYQDGLCSAVVDKGNKPCPYQVNQICELAKSEVRITVEYHIADDFSPPNCNATCVRKELSQILTTLKKRIGPEWNVLKSADAGISSRYQIVPNSKQEAVSESCPAGYEFYQNSVCSACDPGQYWNSSSGKCEVCPLNSWMNEGGAVDKCIECRGNLFTVSTGSTNRRDCKSAMMLKAFHNNQVHRHIGPEDRKEELGKKALKIFIAFLILAVLIFGCVVLPFILYRKTQYQKMQKAQNKKDVERGEKARLLQESGDETCEENELTEINTNETPPNTPKSTGKTQAAANTQAAPTASKETSKAVTTVYEKKGKTNNKAKPKTSNNTKPNKDKKIVDKTENQVGFKKKVNKK